MGHTKRTINKYLTVVLFICSLIDELTSTWNRSLLFFVNDSYAAQRDSRNSMSCIFGTTLPAYQISIFRARNREHYLRVFASTLTNTYRVTKAALIPGVQIKLFQFAIYSNIFFYLQTKQGLYTQTFLVFFLKLLFHYLRDLLIFYNYHYKSFF